MLLAELTVWQTIWSNVVDGVIVAAVVGLFGGLIAWLTKSYQRLVSVDSGISTMNANVAALTNQMTMVLKRLDDHDVKLNEQALWRAKWEGRLEAQREMQQGQSQPTD